MIDKINIEKDIPIPQGKASRLLTEFEMQLSKMDVGDSFYSSKNQYARAISLSQRREGLQNREYTSRKDGSGYRLWRTK